MSNEKKKTTKVSTKEEIVQQRGSEGPCGGNPPISLESMRRIYCYTEQIFELARYYGITPQCFRTLTQVCYQWQQHGEGLTITGMVNMSSELFGNPYYGVKQRVDQLLKAGLIERFGYGKFQCAKYVPTQRVMRDFGLMYELQDIA